MSRVVIQALAVIALFVGLFWGWGHYINGVRVEADAAGYARRDTEQKTADNKALKEALADVARLNRELQGISNDAQTQKAAAVVAAAAAADAGERLRAAESRLRAALGTAASAQASAAAGGASASAAERVLADVRRRLDEAENRVTRYADESRIAGLACERAYDTLN